MKAGAVDLMQKPFSDETNLAVIHSALLVRDQEFARQSTMIGYLNAL
jgi:FixJ family two-component response regulator